MTEGAENIENNRLLVVDDNPSIHADIRKILGRPAASGTSLAEDMALLFDEEESETGAAAFEIESAFQGQEGLAKVEQALAAQRPYALAFVDIRMPPGWDGIETIKRVWQRDPDLQVVICTAYSDYSWEEMFRQLGRSDSLVILKKPFDNIEVLQLAHALTQKWRLNHEVKNHLRDLDKLVRQRTDELQKTNEQLRQSQKMEAVGQLAAGIAHDFNNILTVIQGNASLLLDTNPLESNDRPCVEAISSSAQRAAKLVRQLLTFSRQQLVQTEPMNIADTLSAVAEMLPRILEETVKVKVDVSPNLPLILADAGMMEQMLMNLAVNARDAMPNGGLLAISGTAINVSAEMARGNQEVSPGEFICLKVADTGSGIPPEVLRRIFEPFFTTKPIGKGTGLGLATVYGIAKQHKGWVKVESEVGKGSAFSVFIPVLTKDAVVAVEPPVIAKPAAPLSTNSCSETILFVEDEDPVRELMTKVLESDGYKVFQATSGSVAIERWAEKRGEIDLLLTDLTVPGGLAGQELAGRFMAEAPALKVIYTADRKTGAAQNDTSLAEGQNLLSKPYHPAKLLEMIRDTLGGPLPVKEAVGTN